MLYDMMKNNKKFKKSFEELIRIIMKSFYKFEFYLCINRLLLLTESTNPSIQIISDTLGIEENIIREYIVELKKEKFVKGPDSGLSIDFYNFLNVVQFKIRKIFIKVESRDQEKKSNWQCVTCKKKYSDFDTKDFFDTLTCPFCNSEIVEINNYNENKITVFQFNFQMNRIFLIIKYLIDEINRYKILFQSREITLNINNKIQQPIISFKGLKTDIQINLIPIDINENKKNNDLNFELLIEKLLQKEIISITKTRSNTQTRIQ
jgi:hypothetical protein